MRLDPSYMKPCIIYRPTNLDADANIFHIDLRIVNEIMTQVFNGHVAICICNCLKKFILTTFCDGSIEWFQINKMLPFDILFMKHSDRFKLNTSERLFLLRKLKKQAT